jgi:hypothetical protein
MISTISLLNMLQMAAALIIVSAVIGFAFGAMTQ